MCLAVPAKIISINGDVAKVDFGGVKRDIIISLIEEELKPGDYVMVHAGFAIQKIDEKTALSILELWNEILREEAS
ncbi:MAG: HypC/HybG/HupF family hydrogenase formation chaperone [Candidatus Methanomethylicota archaeon]|uniref:HypC/HybG/HupF family hydrogenase formation chaperone n=1 Tax=Thermoproteota archaeon TaxID=2056631 RepID=A0A497EV13_9CREN|nr:MAG: HypC/HybG/HupF family hydrogenase formation chaperone [Candidatus Verstraetearchaeota archaeon]